MVKSEVGSMYFDLRHSLFDIGYSMLDATQKGHCVDAVAFLSWVPAERYACLTCDVLCS